MNKSIIAFAILSAGLGVANAASEDHLELGTLTCEQVDRENLVIWSEATFACVFAPTEGAPESYTGKVTKVGVDLTVDKVETMKWLVLAASSDRAAGSLEGTYVGASADVAVGAGVGARALVGGFEKSFTLQPVAVSAQTGLGAAVGIEELSLDHAGD